MFFLGLNRRLLKRLRRPDTDLHVRHADGLLAGQAADTGRRLHGFKSSLSAHPLDCKSPAPLSFVLATVLRKGILKATLCAKEATVLSDISLSS